MGAFCGRVFDHEEEDGRSHTGKGKGKGNGTAVVKTGYTVDQFVSENLVPVFGIICRKRSPEARRRPAKEKEHRALQLDANQALTNLYIDFCNARRKEKQAAEGARVFIPFKRIRNSAADAPLAAKSLTGGGHYAQILASEAICNVKFDEARIEESLARKTFDFNQETRLEVKVSGTLIFPPHVVPEYTLFEKVAQMEAKQKETEKATSLESHARQVQEEQEEEFIDVDELWSLQVEVKLVLERYQEDGEDKGAESADLRVRCLDLGVENKVEARGDPLIDSWLPRDDIIQDIEMLLDAKVSQAIAGLAGSS